MAQAYCGERISKHLIRDNAGFLIALSQPICRSGWQPYKMSEIDPGCGDDSMIDVYRPPDEVTSPATIASAEGKPITMRHPPKFLDSNTVGWSSRGHIQNVRVGPRDENGDVTLIADLHIHDGSLIDQILSKNLRDISMGYLYSTDDGPREGTLCQREIRMNHCAVVESGRAGTTYIADASPQKDGDIDVTQEQYERLCNLLEKLLKQNGLSEDAECDCDMPGGKHTKDCPCYGKAKDDFPGAATGKAVAEGHVGEAAGNIAESVGNVVSGVAGLAGAAMGADLIPVSGKGAEGNVNPVSARDARAALQHLRNLRGFIEANGDRKAIDAYNKAIKAVKYQIQLGEGFDSRSAFDSRSLRSRREAEAAQFERNAARFHGKVIKLHQEPNTSDEHRGEDERDREETFDEAVARVRREQIEKWTPKRRR